MRHPSHVLWINTCFIHFIKGPETEIDQVPSPSHLHQAQSSEIDQRQGRPVA